MKDKGVARNDVVDEYSPSRLSAAKERLGYPTQKPLALSLRADNRSQSSNCDDIVLDPFCGCGTTIEAARKLNRRAIGIDVLTVRITSD